MSTPVVVQGTPVSPPLNNNYGDGGTGTGVTESMETEQQEPPKTTGCQDPIFAVLFYLNVIAILVVCGTYGREALNSSDTGMNYTELVYGALVFGVASLVFSAGGLLFLMQYPSFMIKAGLIFTGVMALVSCVYIFMMPGDMTYKAIYGSLSIIFFLITLCYIRAVWSRIPFAATNMITAATAIKANLGVAMFALFFAGLQVVWLVLWSVAYSGVWDKTYVCGNDGCDINYGYLFLLFVSLFFTQQVLQYSVHVIVAGTVATWWINPSESGCCSKGVCHSFIRTISTSFGSICLGSLLVAIIRALQMLANSARSNGDGGFLVCIAECILGCLASCLEYFNKWAYVYVGIYGMSYKDSAVAVMQLFADRGWDAVIADDLVGNAILLTSLVSGLIIGAIAIGYAGANAEFSNMTGDNSWMAFLIGFTAGLSICSILLGTIASGVNAVIVLFAEKPQEFEQNHPELSRDMREKWHEFYPDLM